jgi:hypothetical protein
MLTGNLPTDTTYPDLFKVHIIKSNHGAGATTLMNTIAKASEKQFRMGNEFTVCIVRHNNNPVHVQVWDDNAEAKSLTTYPKAEVELFLTDLTDDDNLAKVEDTLKHHTIQETPPIRILVATKIDLVGDDAVNEADLAKFAQHYHFDGLAIICCDALEEAKELIEDLTAAVMNQRRFLIEEIAFRDKLILDIDQRIKELSHPSFLKSKDVSTEKNLILGELKQALLTQSEKSVSLIIVDLRKKHPIIDKGTLSKTTKTMLDGFIRKSESIEAEIRLVDKEIQALSSPPSKNPTKQ